MRSASGFNLIEVILVLAILAVFLATAASLTPRSAVARDAAALAQFLRLERLRQSLGVGHAAVSCVDVALGSRSSVIVAWPARGLAFDALGVPRTCDGGGVGNATIVLEHRGEQAAVIVSALGRVRWERR